MNIDEDVKKEWIEAIGAPLTLKEYCNMCEKLNDNNILLYQKLNRIGVWCLWLGKPIFFWKTFNYKYTILKSILGGNILLSLYAVRFLDVNKMISQYTKFD